MPEAQDRPNLKGAVVDGLRILGKTVAIIVAICVVIVVGGLIWIELSGGFHIGGF